MVCDIHIPHIYMVMGHHIHTYRKRENSFVERDQCCRLSRSAFVPATTGECRVSESLMLYTAWIRMEIHTPYTCDHYGATPVNTKGLHLWPLQGYTCDHNGAALLIHV